MNPLAHAMHLQRIVGFFETLSPADLDRLHEIYTADAAFKDPFNEVRGVPAIAAIFADMFETLESPRFVIGARILQDQDCFLAWEFRFAFRRWRRGVPQVIRGGSHLVLAADGRIASHLDYWDAAEELYEKMPLVGAAARWLRRRVSG